MIISVFADGRLLLEGGADSRDAARREMRCALGRAGVIPAEQKREGDGATPAGLWPLRRIFWRPDKVSVPASRLPIAAIRSDDGWCDAPQDPAYNSPVRLPYPASAERMWRDDGLYDLVIELGYNDAPVVPGAGSAIFMHVARPDYAPTEGCIALALGDLVELAAQTAPGDAVRVTP
jgi:L,D-peptidoglycan transpeptidase YkuD (ErfK/YbiS/YcfS/YnhG family)